MERLSKDFFEKKKQDSEDIDEELKVLRLALSFVQRKALEARCVLEEIDDVVKKRLPSDYSSSLVGNCDIKKIDH